MPRNCPVCGSVVESENVCRFCGYKLIEGTAQYNPLDLSVDEIPLTQAQHQLPKRAYLHVVSGPQIGAVIPLSSQQVTLGRDPRSDIFLNDMTVSRQHAVITYCDNSYKISDCNSFNGVWINNEVVAFKLLSNGDKVQLGAFTLIYKEES